MISERERLTLLLQGLNTTVTQLEAQIQLQQARINISQSLVESVAQLVKKGAVTDVEYKRRQSDAIDQRQILNSLKQQLATQQNSLTDAQYSLTQLPTATEEKFQALRNEISTIDQRVAEITGKRAFVIRAPMPGRVTALQASVGKLAELNRLQLEIVPTGSTLRAELLVPSAAIGFVHVGQRVNIRYDAFPHQNFGRYGGSITEISKDILTDAGSSAPIALKEPAYRVTAALDRQDIDAYGNRMPLAAGMLLKADIILDRRSLMRWVLDPLFSVKG
jgi:membrane fusion protein